MARGRAEAAERTAGAEAGRRLLREALETAVAGGGILEGVASASSLLSALEGAFRSLTTIQ